MGEPTIEITKKALEDAVNNALKDYFPRLEPISDFSLEFYNKFRREADEYDRDFLDKHNGDLDTTLVFAGLLSGVTSAFILAVQAQLQPDYTQLSYNVLMAIANSRDLEVAPKPDSDSPWTGPDPNLVRIQCVLFSSLAASLLAALVAMLGKQWLNRYSNVDMRSSPIHSGRDRRLKMEGMVTWGFSIVMESLPLLLQFALLLLGYALASYLFTIDKVVAAVVVGFTGFGLLFYGVIAVSAILSYHCPFQTPLSLIVRFVIRSIVELVHDRRRHLYRSRKWFWRTFSQMRKQLIPINFRGFCTADRRDHIVLDMTGPFDYPPTLFDEDTNWEAYVLDSKCIAWMFDMSMDADVTLDIIRFIPEVVWHAGIQTTPQTRLYDTLVECFDLSLGHPKVIPKFRDRAYFSAKALLHVTLQRRFVDNEFDRGAFNSISRQYTTISRQHTTTGSKGDPDLEFTLGMIDRLFGASRFEPIGWKGFSFTDPHRAWMSRILPCLAMESLKKAGSLSDDIKWFVLQSLQVKRPPPATIVTSCLLVIGLLLGTRSHFGRHRATDRSLQFRLQIDAIYEKLEEIFRNPYLTTDEINRALEAMKLIAPLSEDIAKNSHNLFHVIMQASVPEAYSEKKWEASRLAMHGAFQWDEGLPPVKNPEDILEFLNHQFQNPDEPVLDALRALGSVSGPAMTKALKHFDPTQPSFVHRIRSAFQGDRPPQLRKAAFFFLPLIADKWFNTPDPIMEPGEMHRWSRDWASTVDEVGATDDVRTVALVVLFNMINSTHWRAHIAADQWGLLNRCISDPEDSEPFRRCLGNPELIDAIPDVGNPPARVLWLAILWLRYEELDSGVRKKLKAATRALSREDFEVCLSALESELQKASGALSEYETGSEDPIAVALRKNVEGLEKRIHSLLKRAPR